ncbi:MAG: acyl-CoA dehydrogenase family protein [Bacteroidota bacterium]
MDFTWSEEQLDLKDKVLQFGLKELQDDVVARDATGTFASALWKKCADFGVFKYAAPSRYGGIDDKINLIKGIIVMESLGLSCKDNGLALGVSTQMWTVQMPLAHFGTTEQCEEYFPKLLSGELIGAHAITEPEAGSDPSEMKTLARKVENGYVLSGTKCLITLAPVADFFLVFASTNQKLGKWGISAFLVNKDVSGLEIGPSEPKMGLRTVPLGKIVFKDCFVPETARIGKEGAGLSIMNHSLEYDRGFILVSQIGTMQRQINETLLHINQRKQSGKQIKDFQSISNRLADMRLRIETCRLLSYKVAWLKTNNKSALLEAAMLKLHLSESFNASSLDAVRCHGGIGYLQNYAVERNLRDATGGLIYAGTSDIQRNIISQLMEIE